jgi:uncharacterized coiled-coil DUF342 family protein
VTETIDRRLTGEQLFQIEQKMQAERVRYIFRTQVCPPEWIDALIAEVWELRDKLNARDKAQRG